VIYIYIYNLNLVIYVYVIGMNRILWWYWLAIMEIGVANGINGVPLIPAFLKLISQPQVIRWIMLLVKITNIGMVTPG